MCTRSSSAESANGEGEGGSTTKNVERERGSTTTTSKFFGGKREWHS